MQKTPSRLITIQHAQMRPRMPKRSFDQSES